MAEKVKRSKTKYTSIYFNENTKKYDVKYNFKEYDVKTGKNKYRAKWAYNLNTIAEAKQALAELQTGGAKAADKDVTLEGAFELWKIRAQANDFSPVTMSNTEEHLRMIYQFIPATTKVKDIDEDVYYKFCSDIRAHGYEQSEKAYQYNLEVERYCQEQGITIGQYEKQCFWADRDWGKYPEPERYNPDRNIEPEREAPTHSRMEHER